MSSGSQSGEDIKLRNAVEANRNGQRIDWAAVGSAIGRPAHVCQQQYDQMHITQREYVLPEARQMFNFELGDTHEALEGAYRYLDGIFSELIDLNEQQVPMIVQLGVAPPDSNTYDHLDRLGE